MGADNASPSSGASPTTGGTPSDPYLMTGFDKKCIHVFPEGLGAHWLRIVPEADCIATAQLHYT